MHQRPVTPRPRVQGRRSQPRAATSDGRPMSPMSTAAPTAGHTWRPSSTATIVRSWATSSPGEAGQRRPNGRSRRPAWRASGRCVHPGQRLSSAPTTGSSIRVDGSGRPVGTIGCSRSSSRYTPEQNGIIERFFRSLKEECVWQHLFPSFAAARREIAAWIRWYNEARPHQALGYRSPREHRARQGQRVA